MSLTPRVSFYNRLKCCYVPVRSSKRPLSVTDLRLMHSVLNTLTPLDLVFWSAVTLAFRALLRKCHYTYSRHSLLWSDVNLYPDHLVLTIRSSKTDQFLLKPHRIILNSSPESDLCPVKWLYALARAHNPRECDHIFRAPGPRGLALISYRWFNNCLKELSASIGLDPTMVSSHCLRHGGAFFMSAQGIDIADIRARGSWAASAIFRYLHHSDDALREKDRLISDYL